MAVEIGFFQTAVRKTVGKYSDYPERLVNPGEVFGNIVPVMLDNIPFPAVAAERQGINHNLTEQVLPQDLRRSLIDIMRDWPDGHARGAIITVGTPESGSAHPHFFEATKTPDGMQLIFVDPEKTVGSRNFFKPNVVNLIAARIHNDTSAEFAYLRFRSSFLDSRETHVAAQYLVAETLLETDGNPDILKEHRDQVLFRIALTPDHSVLQARFVLPWRVASFVEHGKGAISLEHRLSELGKIMGFFPEALKLTGHQVDSYNGVMRRVEELYGQT